jgi:hypothetical protein
MQKMTKWTNDSEVVPVHPLPSTDSSVDGFKLNTVQRVYAICYPRNLIFIAIEYT